MIAIIARRLAADIGPSAAGVGGALGLSDKAWSSVMHAGAAAVSEENAACERQVAWSEADAVRV
jgi:hypothetical protein